MTLSLHNYQSIYSLWWNYLNVEYPIIGKYGQHKFYMYEGEGQRKQNEERKYLYDMERRVEKHHKWKTKQIYVYFHSNPKINGTMTMLFITGFYPHIIFYEIRMTINLIVSPVTPYITYKSWHLHYKCNTIFFIIQFFTMCMIKTEI